MGRYFAGGAICARVMCSNVMTAENGLKRMTTIAAIMGTLPHPGQECVIALSAGRSYARLVDISALHQDPQGIYPGQSRSHWSQLASMRIEVPSDAAKTLLICDRAAEFKLLDETGVSTIAAGLAIQCEPGLISTGASGVTIWLTGLSGAGKSTIAQELERRLKRYGKVECLDADVVRTHLCRGLGFSAEDRIENVRRLALAARMIAETGATVLVSAISPYRVAREEARAQSTGFIEVYVNAPLSVCESRDVKGLYKRARSGEITSFTGIDDPYEPPLAPEVECCTDVETVEESVEKIVAAIQREDDRVTSHRFADEL